TWTTPIYNRTVDYNADFDAEKNADVLFVSKGNTVKLKYNATNNCYITTDANFNVGDQVQMKIKYKDHAELSSSTIIPAKPKFDMKYLGKETIDHGNYSETYVKFNFKCLSNEAVNYFRINMIAYSSEGIHIIRDQLYLGDSEFQEMAPNTLVTLKSYFSYYTLDSVRYSVLSCSEEYYKYHLSVRNYQGDDFFVEPSLIYDNVENGIGNFSAFNMVSDTLLIK
ncbi:MAG: DUF4249 family protein, partial [Bacteroidales bacterium]|nr:DUF4249 family protein [Bacteroidales bacterium]